MSMKDISKKVDDLMSVISEIKEDSGYTRGVLESLVRDQTEMKQEVAVIKADQNKMKGGVVVVSAVVGGVITFVTKMLFKG
jgi:hypothetical protein